tara:strand:+ start:560 stop:805 length:246 start_codon:yes stop_codon:yes gene_type:complete
MVSEREVKRIIAEVIPNRQFKAEAREAIARRTQQFMEELIRSVVNYTKNDSERITANHVTLAWAYYNDALDGLEDEDNVDE